MRLWSLLLVRKPLDEAKLAVPPFNYLFCFVCALKKIANVRRFGVLVEDHPTATTFSRCLYLSCLFMPFFLSFQIPPPARSAHIPRCRRAHPEILILDSPSFVPYRRNSLSLSAAARQQLDQNYDRWEEAHWRLSSITC